MDTWSTVDSQGHDNMEAGEGLFPLSSGFNSALLGYHIAKLLRGEVILVEILVSLPLSWMKNLGV